MFETWKRGADQSKFYYGNKKGKDPSPSMIPSRNKLWHTINNSNEKWRDDMLLSVRVQHIQH